MDICNHALLVGFGARRRSAGRKIAAGIPLVVIETSVPAWMSCANAGFARRAGQRAANEGNHESGASGLRPLYC
ncbi:hypothetical protein KCP77_19675 [Salmonella enterica subsp. enterica]|nr:hypothetical protein KCP77_19675 [Salmonella enterica subsp. enterica]